MRRHLCLKSLASALVFGTSLLPIAEANQVTQHVDPLITTTRAYRVGDKDVYHLAITSDPSGSLKATLTEEVTKVYPSGDADILETVSNLETTGDFKMTTPAPRTVRYTSFGVVLGDAPQDPITIVAFSAIIPNVDHLGPKQFLTFERALPSMGNADVKANARIVENDGNLVGIAIQGKLLNAFGQAPGSVSDIAGKLVWDIKANRYDKGSFFIEGKDPGTDKPIKYGFSIDRDLPTTPPPTKG